MLFVVKREKICYTVKEPKEVRTDMANKKDNLPLTVDPETEQGSSITYANEVVAIIAGVAAGEVEGIAGMCAASGITDILGRNRNIT